MISKNLFRLLKNNTIMKHIKKFNESFLDFFKKKENPFDNEDIKEIVSESFLDLSDKGFDIKVNLDKYYDSWSQTPIDIIDIEIQKNDESDFSMSDVKSDIKVALSYLKEYNLKLDNIYYREIKWTTTKRPSRWNRSGRATKKEINLNKLSKLKDDESTNKLKITLK